MSDGSSFDGLAAFARRRKNESAFLLAALGLMPFALGYEAGSVMAGEPMELAWLVSVLLGCAVAVSSLLGGGEE